MLAIGGGNCYFREIPNDSLDFDVVFEAVSSDANIGARNKSSTCLQPKGDLLIRWSELTGTLIHVFPGVFGAGAGVIPATTLILQRRGGVAVIRIGHC